MKDSEAMRLLQEAYVEEQLSTWEKALPAKSLTK